MSDFPQNDGSLRVPSTAPSANLAPPHANRPPSEKVSFAPPLESPNKVGLSGRRSSYMGVTVSVEEDVLEEQMQEVDVELGRSRSRLSGTTSGAFDEFPRLD